MASEFRGLTAKRGVIRRLATRQAAHCSADQAIPGRHCSICYQAPRRSPCDGSRDDRHSARSTGLPGARTTAVSAWPHRIGGGGIVLVVVSLSWVMLYELDELALTPRRPHLHIEPYPRECHRQEEALFLVSATLSAADAGRRSTTTKQLSMLLDRSTATTTGVIASSAAESDPASTPNVPCVNRYTMTTASTPSMTCGTCIAIPLKPICFAPNAWRHMAIGG